MTKAKPIRLIRDLDAMVAADRGAVCAMGNFDGVHPGHRLVIAEAKNEADRQGVPSGVITFEPHPRQFFDPNTKPFRLTSLHAKTRLLEELGVDIVYALPFDEALASMPADGFVQEILVNKLGINGVVTGEDFRFGKRRGGDCILLQELADRLGFEAKSLMLLEGPHAASGKEAYSSTAIREALREGDIDHATTWLGRLWCADGVVVKGDQRGRTIGFPTINVPMGPYIYPAHGAYALVVEVLDGAHAGVYSSVGNLGRRPTFDKKDVLLEAHLFDFEGDLYGAHVYVYLVEFLRPEMKFDGLDALKAQIAKDSDKARAILAELGPPRLIGV